MKKVRLLLALSFLLLQIQGFPQGNIQTSPEPGLQNGPMLGYVDMKEALIWVQTFGADEVYARYWDTTRTNIVFETDRIRTEKSNGYTAHLIADRVEPGTCYAYRIVVNGKELKFPYPTRFSTQPLWRYRMEPPNFSVATGSCFYVNEPQYDRPGRAYGSSFDIFNNIAAQSPNLMLWLGDNTYYREPDWSTRTGMIHRNTHTRNIPQLQPLLAAAHHYAVWDDHDYGPNDSDGTWPHKETAWEVFKAFWGNPTFGVNGQKGCTSWFQYIDVDFFLLDDRYFRTPNTCESCPRTYLGKEQLDWFLSALAASNAPFKLVAVGGQVVSDNPNHESMRHLFPAERDTILAHIEREKIKGVVFLTGDRHFTELTALKNNAGITVYDLTTSPLTSGAYAEAAKESNTFRVEGTIVTTQNFSMLRFSGPRTDRQLDITNYDANGKVLWTKTIRANE